MHKTKIAPSASTSSSGVEAQLSPILRLRQIAEELRAAARINDVEVMCAAADMLEPTMDDCDELLNSDPQTANEAAEIAQHIRTVLTECEALLTSVSVGVADEMKRIRQGKRTVATIRGRASHEGLVQNTRLFGSPLGYRPPNVGSG